MNDVFPIIGVPRDLVDTWQYLKVPFPRTPRDMFLSLRLMAYGLSYDAFLDRIDFSEVSTIDMYYALLGRPPESANMILNGSDSEAYKRDLFTGALASSEFRHRCLSIFLNAFPEKKRLVFIHIPKCAGTDFEMNIVPKFVSIAADLVDWAPDYKLLETLAGLTLTVEFFDTIFYYGHIIFEDLKTNFGIRPSDRFLTILRDPIEILLSAANYIVSRLMDDPQALAADCRYWLSVLGLGAPLEKLEGNGGFELGLRILYNENLVGPNPICRYLGNGNADRTIDNLVIFNFEITDTTHYQQWLGERWDVSASKKTNQSTAYLTRENVADHLHHLARITDQDQLVYDKVSGTLALSGGTSIFGFQLLRAT